LQIRGVGVQRKSFAAQKNVHCAAKIHIAEERTAIRHAGHEARAGGGFVQLQIAVAPGDFDIGRDNAADLHIPNEFVALRHCFASVGPDRYEIKEETGPQTEGKAGTDIIALAGRCILKLKSAMAINSTSPEFFQVKPLWNAGEELGTSGICRRIITAC
jgi:hypothetical protein